MRFGVYVNGYGSSVRSAGDVLREAAEQAQLAEQLGFDWVVLGERHLYRPGHAEILTAAAWLAARTHRIGIATAGIVAAFYPPYLLAQALANIDVASNGRLHAGFVLGYRPEEFAAFGARFDQRAATFESTVAAIARLWTGQTVDLPDPARDSGDAVATFVSPLPVQRPRPPIWNGGRVRAALRRTAWICDAWTTSFNEDPQDLAGKIEQYRGFPAGPDSLGKSVIVCRDGFCASTSQAARNTLEAPLLDLFGEYSTFKRGSIDAGRYRQLSWDNVADRLLVGSPAQFTEQLNTYAELGADALILRIQPPRLAHRDAMACLELLGTQVLPAFTESASTT